MQNNKLILLNFSSDVIYAQLYNILHENNYRVERAVNIQSAIQKTIELIPDLIICSNDFMNYDAFQTYNLLKRTTINCATPYIVYIENYENDDIVLGLELGVDNFIFAPLNEKRIISKLKILFEKIERHKAFEKSSFDKLFVSSPVGMLICDSGRIECANQAFYRLFPFNEDGCLPTVNDIFNFESGQEKEKEFERCINGLTNECVIKDVNLKKASGFKINLIISNISNSLKNRTLIQFEISSDTARVAGKNYYMEFGECDKSIHDPVLTAREFDVLKISGKGMPIKLIASELGISQRTVEKHRSNIMRKTDSVNIIEAIDKVYGIYKETS